MAWRNSTIIPPFPDDIDRRDFGHYLSGFTDGEGCFTIFWHGEGHGSARFSIGLRHDDQRILQLIQSFWGCGFLGYRHGYVRKVTANPQSVFRVSHLSHLTRIVIPHFERFPLRAKKAGDFAIWRRGVEMLYRIKKIRNHGRGIHGGSGRGPKWTSQNQSDFQALISSLRSHRDYDASTTSCSDPSSKPADGQLRMWGDDA